MVLRDLEDGDKEAHPPQQQSFRKGRRPLTDKLSVLIVDDDEIVGEMTALVLGHICPLGGIILATSGEEALTLCEKTSFDIVLCDFVLGFGMNGAETIRAIRMLRGSKVKLIGFSGSHDRFGDAPCTLMWSKPLPTPKRMLADLRGVGFN